MTCQLTTNASRICASRHCLSVGSTGAHQSTTLSFLRNSHRSRQACARPPRAMIGREFDPSNEVIWQNSDNKDVDTCIYYCVQCLNGWKAPHLAQNCSTCCQPTPPVELGMGLVSHTNLVPHHTSSHHPLPHAQMLYSYADAAHSCTTIHQSTSLVLIPPNQRDPSTCASTHIQGRKHPHPTQHDKCTPLIFTWLPAPHMEHDGCC